MASDARQDAEPWTLQEGARDAARILAPRALIVAVIWALPLVAFRAYARVLAELSGAPSFTPPFVNPSASLAWRAARRSIGAAVLVGVGCGWFVHRRLVELVRFDGWIPPLMSACAACTAIAITTAILVPTFPPALTGAVWVVAAFGAGGALLRIGIGAYLDA